MGFEPASPQQSAQEITVKRLALGKTQHCQKCPCTAIGNGNFSSVWCSQLEAPEQRRESRTLTLPDRMPLIAFAHARLPPPGLLTFSESRAEHKASIGDHRSHVPVLRARQECGAKLHDQGIEAARLIPGRSPPRRSPDRQAPPLGLCPGGNRWWSAVSPTKPPPRQPETGCDQTNSAAKPVFAQVRSSSASFEFKTYFRIACSRAVVAIYPTVFDVRTNVRVGGCLSVGLCHHRMFELDLPATLPQLDDAGLSSQPISQT